MLTSVLEENNTETIVELKIIASNNHTLTSEQNMEVFKSKVIDQVEVAIMLDGTTDEDIERRGYSGLGANAKLMAVLDDDTEEQINTFCHPLVLSLPIGSAKKLRQFIKKQREASVWDGHNMRSGNTFYSEALLRKIRQI